MSQNEEAIGSPKLFQRDGMPPIKDLLPTSLQHVLACFAGAIAPAMMTAAMMMAAAMMILPIRS